MSRGAGGLLPERHQDKESSACLPTPFHTVASDLTESARDNSLVTHVPDPNTDKLKVSSR